MERARSKGRDTATRRIFPANAPELGTYPARVIVAGSRGFDDYRRFVRVLEQYLLDIHSDSKYCFISGAARSGADRLIIDYTRKPLYCYQFPAAWELHGKSAGYLRNVEMALEGTHLLVFWDGKSRGTLHMIKTALRKGLQVHLYRYDLERSILCEPIYSLEDLEYGWKP